MGFLEKIKNGLSKTREGVFGRIGEALKSSVKIDDELYEELEEILISGDIGVSTAIDLIENLRVRISKERVKDPARIYPLLEDEIGKFLAPAREETLHSPEIILIVGVNGTGKTTSIGKLVYLLKKEGKKALVGAADTFRAAAIEQLAEWAEKTDTPLVKHQPGADPSAVAYDAAAAGKARGFDYVIIDTAGRLHTKQNLMGELEKISRTLKKIDPEAPHQTLLVLDATTGQNAIAQAKEFSKATPITGIILTKLDGTAKGGVTIGISHELGIPIRYLGTGEGIDDLEPFDKAAFIRGLFG